MKKFVAILTTFLIGWFLVTEIRTERSMQCFGCNNLKCVIKTVDENPALIFTHYSEIIAEAQQVPNWWD
ncbi:MAG: hypothetical protein ACKVQJ_04755 [Pyrinomonadaceae bacterium]